MGFELNEMLFFNYKSIDKSNPNILIYNNNASWAYIYIYIYIYISSANTRPIVYLKYTNFQVMYTILYVQYKKIFKERI